MRRTEHDGPLDLGGMQSLAERVFPQTGYRSIGDLAWNYALCHDRPQDCPTVLWRDGSTVVAWAWLERPADLMLQVDPRFPQLADEALGWGEPLVTGPMSVEVAATETPVIGALSRRGYQLQDGPFMACLSRSLADVPDVPPLPAGYVIRPAGKSRADLDRRAAVHRSAFSGSRLDAGRHELVTALHPYRRELDLVAEAPGGTFGAYCLGWYDDRNRVGEFEPVGTRPGHRRLGLARAVCTAVLHGFRAAGGERAVVNARGDADYPAPRLVYESLGFRQYTRTRWYRQPA